MKRKKNQINPNQKKKYLKFLKLLKFQLPKKTCLIMETMMSQAIWKRSKNQQKLLLLVRAKITMETMPLKKIRRWIKMEIQKKLKKLRKKVVIWTKMVMKTMKKTNDRLIDINKVIKESY
jgi:hypothetical protein